ncbi:MAG: NADH:flavin oxidoreductase [Flavobacteriales bacterium]|nr:NADH:flavin oxidoreductase [Flavobacteriales bacterium]MCB9185224.1 NADH:flavin oxidoreductase [Flavobacteriales bacterium]
MLFSPFKLGPVTLRNRTIRAAAFEGMCPNNLPSDQLTAYHKAVAAGGIGMTTVAYAATERSGLSFPHQLLLNEEALPGLRVLTEAVHKEGAACSIQIGHCGNMAKRSVTGLRPLAPTSRINMYGPTFPKAMTRSEIQESAKAFGRAVKLARSAGFDAVEVHAGHGYLISQFLSPYTNQRNDEFGGSLENRSKFMRMVMDEVKQAAGTDMAVLVKMNMRDGFLGGMQLEESLEVAKMLQQDGADALVLSGGFVSKAPMYILKGAMPIRVLAHYMDDALMRVFVRLFGDVLIKKEKFEEAYFLKDALLFREQVDIPLVYVGGLISREKIDKVLGNGFELVAMARALLKDPDFVNRLLDDELSRSSCDTCNYCIARMYSREVSCIQNENLTAEMRALLS